MFELLFGVKTRFIDYETLDLLTDKYFGIYLVIPLDLITLHSYLHYLKYNSIVKVESTPNAWYTESVPYWVTDRNGVPYDYIRLLDGIFECLAYCDEHGCIRMKRFSQRVHIELNKLQLDFKYKRVKK